jgi:hypothetical protein
MAAPTIPNGKEHFFPVVYSGNGQGQTVGSFVPFTDNGTIAKSCMFNDGDSGYLSRTPSGTGNRRTFTFSGWVKRGVFDTSNGNDLFNAGTNPGNNVDQLLFDSSNRIRFYSYGGSYLFQYITNRTFEDTSKWYHIVCAVDTTQSSASDRVKIYVDGDLITSFSTETDPALNGECFHFNNTSTHYIGANVGSQRFYDGYIAEYNFVDGTALGPDTFGVTDTSTGRWIPKALTGITYGSNGFRLQFGTSSALGDDTSGNTNDFSVTNLVATDQRNDTPTNNLPTMRPYNPSYNTTQAQGNLQYTATGTNAGYPMCSTLRPNSGKWYAEVRTSTNGGGNVITMGIYIQEDMHSWDNSANFYPGGQLSNGDGCGAGLWVSTGTNYLVSSTLDAQVVTSNPTYSLAAGDVFGIAVDVDNSLVSFYGNNGSLIGSTSILRPGRIIFTAMAVTSSDTWNWNFGDNPTFDGNETAGGNADGDGNGNFYHSVPTGFKMLRQDNMPTTDKGVSGFTWLKDRDNATNHYLVNSSRGYENALYSNSDGAEVFLTAGLRNPLKGGFEVLDGDPVNGSGRRFVSWNWVANGGTTASNGDGSITTTTQVNSTAGFSIIQYTGTEANATIGHGLSQTPDWFMIKALESHSPNGYWIVWHKSFAANQLIYLNLSLAIDTSTTMFNNTLPTSSVINLGSNFNTNMSGDKMICYAWHEVDGFSKFSTYVGNGSSSDGPFIYTGFRPAWVMWKATDAEGWYIYDTKRNAYNGQGFLLRPDVTNADYDYGISEGIIALSNGFKVYGNSGWHNTSGQTYLYFAFAEHPFVGDGTNPVTAR